MKPLRDWSDHELGAALLSALWRSHDAGGTSHGRSYENRLLEAAQAVLDLPRPEGDVTDWPPLDDIAREAERRHRERVLAKLRDDEL